MQFHMSKKLKSYIKKNVKRNENKSMLEKNCIKNMMEKNMKGEKSSKASQFASINKFPL